MAEIQLINLGTSPGDKTGDKLRAGGQKINTNFQNINQELSEKSTLALGETQTTAYRGDRGKTAYDHSQTTHAPSSADQTQSAIHGATTKATPVDADTLCIIDSAASNVLKKTTWANIKATLKTYFDTLYSTLSLGETSITAYRGDRGKTAYDHSQAAHAPSDALNQTGVDGRITTLRPDANYLNSNTTKTQVGLANVDNTSDANKPVSSAQQTAINLKQDSLSASVHGALINAATAKTTPVDADMVGLMDSAVSNGLKKLSWANIKATLKTYFDSIYSTLALGETSVTAYRGDRGKTAYDHSQSAHAPSNAQKNSDITKAEIEAKLTGAITSHTHAADHTHSNKSTLDKIGEAVGEPTWNGGAWPGAGGSSSPDKPVNALGSISGSVNINLANGTFVFATLTGSVTLSFHTDGRPAAGYMREFMLYFINNQTINWPGGTMFVGGVQPVVIGTTYAFQCIINSDGVVTVGGLIDNIS